VFSKAYRSRHYLRNGTYGVTFYVSLFLHLPPTPSSGSAIPITGMALPAYESFLIDYLHVDLISAPSLHFLRFLFRELISFPTKCDRRRGVPRRWLSSPLMPIEELDHVLADVTPPLFINYLLCVRLCYN
jgi:hypothetical protein